mgnify:CR=1 FL=1
MQETAEHYADEICQDIRHLSTTLFNLMEIDSRVLGPGRKARILRMRQIVFDTLELYILSTISDATLDEGEEIPDNRSMDDDE